MWWSSSTYGSLERNGDLVWFEAVSQSKNLKTSPSSHNVNRTRLSSSNQRRGLSKEGNNTPKENQIKPSRIKEIDRDCDPDSNGRSMSLLNLANPETLKREREKLFTVYRSSTPFRRILRITEHICVVELVI